MHQMALLQVLQGLRKHLLGAVRHEAANLVEAQYARIAPVQQLSPKRLTTCLIGQAKYSALISAIIYLLERKGTQQLPNYQIILS